MTRYELKSSGAEQSFPGGAIRDTAVGKPIMHLLPPWMWRRYVLHGEYVASFMETQNPKYLMELSDLIIQKEGLEAVCMWLELGAKRYSPWNWALGIPVSRCIDSLGRHLLALGREEQDEHHAAAALCNIGFIVHYMTEIGNKRLDPKWNDLFDFDMMKEKRKAVAEEWAAGIATTWTKLREGDKDG